MSMTHDEMIAVIIAHKHGKTIQSKLADPIEEMSWVNLGEACLPAWNFQEYLYRIKPEPPKPREIWVHGDGIDICVHTVSPCDKCVLFREVPPDEEGKA